MRKFIVFTGSVLSALSLMGGAVVFDAKPKATKVKNGIEISFSISAPSDVEIAVLSADGSIVCHLAAGVLGGANVPPAPLVPGLAQKLVWDGKDDFGKDAVGGPFSIRVRAGTRAGFDGFVGASPYAMGRVRGLAVDAKGELFVLEQSYDAHFPGPFGLRVYGRDGAYRRTLMPFPAGLKASELKEFKVIEKTDGTYLPCNQYSVWPHVYPFTSGGLKLSQSILPGGVLFMHDEAFSRVFMISADTGKPIVDRFGTPLWIAGTKMPGSARGGTPVLAVAPDASSVYAVGLAARAPKGEKSDPNWPDGRIYKFSLDGIGKNPEIYADLPIPEKPATIDPGWTAEAAVSGLRGIAIDGKGNIYVCDFANTRVVCLSPDGKELGAVDVTAPFSIAVHPQGGTAYVTTCPVPGKECEKKLVRIAGFPAAPKVEMELTLGKAAAAPFLAIDHAAPKVAVWTACPHVMRFEDHGNEFKKTVDFNELTDHATALATVDKMTVDYRTDDLYINGGWNRTARFNGLTGKYNGPEKNGAPDQLVVTDTAISPDGYIYVQRGPGFSGPVERLDRNFNPAPTVMGKSVLGSVYARYGAGYCEKGMCVGWDGKFYVLAMYDWARYAIFAFGEDGKPLEGPSLIGAVKAKEAVSSGFTSCIAGPLYDRCGGLRIDREGNLYMGAQALPKNHIRPAEFEKNEAYTEMVGSVLKIKPGANLNDKNQRVKTLDNFEGALTVYPDLAPFSGWRRSDCCVCRTPRFDLDPYGRLVIPNAITCEVRMVDNAGNEILSFGSYGNFDSQYVSEKGDGKTPLISSPAVPLAWPLGAGFSQTKIYVADMLNRRVVRMAIKYDIEAICKSEI